MGAGNSTIPASAVCVARRCRLTMFTPSMVTRPVLRCTRSTRPCLPLSSPEMTCTVSPLVPCRRCRTGACCRRARGLPAPAGRPSCPRSAESIPVGPWLLGPFDDFGDPPADRLRERPRLHDPHDVARAGGAVTLDVARLDLLGPGDLLAVDRVRVAAHQRDGDRLGHLVAGHDARPALAAGAR